MKEKSYYSMKGYVSNSALSHFLHSPRKFRKFILGELEEESQSYLELGKLIHLRLLEIHVYNSEIVPFDYIIPRSGQQKQFITDYINLKDVDATPELTAYRKAYPLKKESDEKATEKAKELLETLVTYRQYLKASETRTVIQESIHEDVKTVESNVRRHKRANELLYDVSEFFDTGEEDESYNEIALFHKDEDLKFKALIDRVVVDHANKKIKLIDVKTSSKLHKFRESFDSYEYDRQLAFYDFMIRQNLDKFRADESYEIDHHIVAIDTITKEVKTFLIDKNIIHDASKRIEDILESVRWHFKNDEWDHSMEYYTGNGDEKIR